MTKNEKHGVLTMVGMMILCLVIAGISHHENGELHRQIRDLSQELAHSKIPIQVDTIRDSIPVFTQTVVEVEPKDYKKLIADSKMLKDLEIKYKQVLSENRMLLETRDTVFLHSISETDSMLYYNDRWADFMYNMNNKLLNYRIRDSLDIFVTKIYRHKFLWIRWGTKGYKVKTVSLNPHAEVKESQYFRIKK